MISNVTNLKKISLGKEIKIISFDIFDTLLIRKTDPPEDIKRIITNKIVSSGLLNKSPVKILSLRKSLEKKIRQTTKDSGFDPECSIEDVIESLLNKLNEDISLKEKLLKIELSVEKSLISPMPGMEYFLNSIKKKYKLIAASDTYFPLYMLKVLLDSKGLGKFFDTIYASCDYKLNKNSGRLFEKVLELEKIKPSQLIHIGDNSYSDYFIPKSKQINSILLYEEWNLKRRGLLRILNKKEKKSHFWKGYSFINRITSAEKQKEIENHEFYYWGRNVIGPLLAIFTHILCIEIEKEKFDRVYFLARDGFILKNLFKIFSEELFKNYLPSPTYLAISRYSSLVPSIKTLGERELKLALYGLGWDLKKDVEIKDILKSLGITDINNIIPVLERNGLSPSEPYNDKKKDRIIHHLFRDPDFKKTITEHSNSTRILLEKYLRQIKFFNSGKIALIDAGWPGTIQDSIEYTFRDMPGFPSITGYYIAHTSPLFESGANKKGLIFDYRRPSPEGLSINFFREGLESSCRALHNTTTGYKKSKNGNVIPLFKKATNRTAEKQVNKFISVMQKGILDFSNEYINLIKNFDISPEELKPFITKLYDTHLSFPKDMSLKVYEKIWDTADSGSKHVRNMVEKFSCKDIFYLKDFLTSLRAVPWREGTLTKMGIPFFTTCYYMTKRIVSWNKIKGKMR